MSNGQARKTQSDRTEEALTALRKTALELMVKEGIHGLKLSEVGIKAGYSRGIVNYHFGTKNDLLIDLLDNAARRGEELYEHTSGSGLSMLENMFDELILMVTQQAEETTGLLLLIHEATFTPDEKLRERLIEYNHRARRSLEYAINAAQGTASTHNEKTSAELAILILALIRGVHSQWLTERDSFDVVGALQRIKASLPALLGHSNN